MKASVKYKRTQHTKRNICENDHYKSFVIPLRHENKKKHTEKQIPKSDS